MSEQERRNHLLDSKDYLKEAERLLLGHCRECLLWDLETLMSELDEEIASADAEILGETGEPDISLMDPYSDDIF